MSKFLDLTGLTNLVGHIKTIASGKSDTGHKHAAGDITSGTLPVARGGTGQTTLENACNSLLNGLSTGSSDPQDNDYFISQYAGGGTTTTTYHRRPVSALYNYIKGKLDSVYAAKSHNHAGVYLTAHPTITNSDDTTSTPTALAHSGTFTAVTSVTRDSNGHVTTLNTATYTLPASGNTDTKVATSNKAATKMFLVGATTQSTSGQTGYSNANVYIGTDNCLYCMNDAGTASAKVVTDISGKANLSGATFTGNVTVPKLIIGDLEIY